MSRNVISKTCRVIAAAALLAVGISKSEAKTINFDCKPNKSLQNTIDAANPGDRINVSGTCNEQVIVRTDRLTIDGLGSAVIDGAGVTLDVGGLVRILASQTVIRSFTIQNSQGTGIVILRSASALIFSNTIQNNATNGISLSNSSSALIGFSGIQDRHNRPSEAGDSDGNTIQGNGGNGILVSSNSSASISHNDIHGVKDGNNAGVYVRRGGSADIDSNLIDGFDRGINVNAGGWHRSQKSISMIVTRIAGQTRSATILSPFDAG